MRFDDTIIDRVLLESSIIDEFEALGVNLKRSGREYTGLCPFHGEKTPSFYVNPDKNQYYCHGCGEKGSIFDLLKKKSGMEFRQAMEYLAKKAGIDLDGYNDQSNNEDAQKRMAEIETLARINLDALEWFQGQLHQSDRARAYLKERGFEPSTLGAFSLGWGGGDERGLFNYLVSKGYTEDQVIKSDLVIKSDKGGVYDRFRNRVIFSIYDNKGRLTGFSGRVLPGDDKSRAKYLNSSETALFKKDSLLYGYQENAQSCRDLKLIVLVEGYTDVMGLYQAGYRVAMAPMGTALTERHATLIRRMGVEQLYLMFDPDEAGRKAARRACVTLGPSKWDLKVALLPKAADKDGKPVKRDPAVIATEDGGTVVNDLLMNAVSPLDVLFEDLESAFEFAKKYDLSIERERFLQALARKLGVSYDAVKDDYDRREKPDTKKHEQDDTDGETYTGQTSFPTRGGPSIEITKEWKMYQKTVVPKKASAPGEADTEETFVPITSSHVLIPKYRVQLDSDVIYTIEARWRNEKPKMISIPESTMGEATKLQNALARAGIAINVGRLRNLIHDYCLTNSVNVKPANVGVNYDADGQTFICGYDYICKDGRIYKSKDNIVDTGKEIYFITGYEMRYVSTVDQTGRYYKPVVSPDGKIQEFIKLADRLFHNEKKSRIACAFLMTAMLREKLVAHFGECPSLNFYGKAASVGKSTFLIAMSAITNIKYHRAAVTEYQLYFQQENRANGLIMIDDMKPVENYIGFLKDAASNSFRTRRNADGKQTYPQLRNSVFMTTNGQVTIESEDDAEALESRVINVHFTRDDSIFSFKHYSKFESFYKEFAFDIYMDFYNHVRAVNFRALAERIEEIEGELVALKLKTSRIVKMWAMLIACGEAAGIRMPLKEYTQFISQSEAEKVNKSDILAAALMEAAIYFEKKAQPDKANLDKKDRPLTRAERGREEVLKQVQHYKPGMPNEIYNIPVFEKNYFLKISDAAEFFRHNQVLKDFSQESILKEIYPLDFVRKHPHACRMKIREGEPVRQTGSFIEINFAHEMFKNTLGIIGDYVYVKPAADESEYSYKEQPEDEF